MARARAIQFDLAIAHVPAADCGVSSVACLKIVVAKLAKFYSERLAVLAVLRRINASYRVCVTACSEIDEAIHDRHIP